jgi:hypothetical protein
MRATWAVVLLLGCGAGTVGTEGDADPGTTPEPMTLPRADVDEVEDDVAWMRADAAVRDDLGGSDVPAPQGEVIRGGEDVVTAPPDVVTARADVVTPSLDAGTTLPEQRCTLRSTTFDAAMQEIDVGPTSATRLRFTIPDVPAGVTSARATRSARSSRSFAITVSL